MKGDNIKDVVEELSLTGTDSLTSSSREFIKNSDDYESDCSIGDEYQRNRFEGGSVQKKNNGNFFKGFILFDALDNLYKMYNYKDEDNEEYYETGYENKQRMSKKKHKKKKSKSSHNKKGSKKNEEDDNSDNENDEVDVNKEIDGIIMDWHLEKKKNKEKKSSHSKSDGDYDKEILFDFDDLVGIQDKETNKDVIKKEQTKKEQTKKEQTKKEQTKKEQTKKEETDKKKDKEINRELLENEVDRHIYGYEEEDLMNDETNEYIVNSINKKLEMHGKKKEDDEKSDSETRIVVYKKEQKNDKQKNNKQKNDKETKKTVDKRPKKNTKNDDSDTDNSNVDQDEEFFLKE